MEDATGSNWGAALFGRQDSESMNGQMGRREKKIQWSGYVYGGQALIIPCLALRRGGGGVRLVSIGVRVWAVKVVVVALVGGMKKT